MPLEVTAIMIGVEDLARVASQERWKRLGTQAPV
jgi:hypothetical protein